MGKGAGHTGWLWPLGKEVCFPKQQHRHFRVALLVGARGPCSAVSQTSALDTHNLTRMLRPFSFPGRGAPINDSQTARSLSAIGKLPFVLSSPENSRGQRLSHCPVGSLSPLSASPVPPIGRPEPAANGNQAWEMQSLGSASGTREGTRTKRIRLSKKRTQPHLKQEWGEDLVSRESATQEQRPGGRASVRAALCRSHTGFLSARSLREHQQPVPGLREREREEPQHDV